MVMRRTGTGVKVFPSIVTLMALFLIFCLCGCACERPQIVTTVLDLGRHGPIFPPQAVMDSGDYRGFMAENEKALEDCDGTDRCSAALFNLGFLHAYSKSPYYNRARALWYFKTLLREYPESSWTYQSLAWVDLIEKKVILVRNHNELNRWQSEELNRLQSEIKMKDEAIDELRAQMKRSRDIDVELDRKEKELIY
jgi:hypothetical protein